MGMKSRVHVVWIQTHYIHTLLNYVHSKLIYSYKEVELKRIA